MLIFPLLVSNLILNYSLTVASRRYVEKLTPVAHSSVFKRQTVLAFKWYYDFCSTTTVFYIGLSTFSTSLLQPQYGILASVLPVLPSSTITRLYIIHGHVRISLTNVPRDLSRYALLTWFEPVRQDYLCTQNVTNPLYRLFHNDVSTNCCPVSGFRSIHGYNYPFCYYNSIGGCFPFNINF